MLAAQRMAVSHLSLVVRFPPVFLTLLFVVSDCDNQSSRAVSPEIPSVPLPEHSGPASPRTYEAAMLLLNSKTTANIADGKRTPRTVGVANWLQSVDHDWMLAAAAVESMQPAKLPEFQMVPAPGSTGALCFECPDMEPPTQPSSVVVDRRRRRAKPALRRNTVVISRYFAVRPVIPHVFGCPRCLVPQSRIPEIHRHDILPPGSVGAQCKRFRSPCASLYVLWFCGYG